MHLIASLHFPIIHINRHTTHTHRCMQYINTAGNSGSDTHTLMHTRQCTHTVIWLNMLQNIARWFWSDIFITLHPLLVFNAILLPQLLLSISGTGHISFCACVRGTVCVCVRACQSVSCRYISPTFYAVKHLQSIHLLSVRHHPGFTFHCWGCNISVIDQSADYFPQKNALT